MLIGQITLGSFGKRFHIHEDLRQDGIQEIEWLEIPASVTTIRDLLDLIRGEFGIDQGIKISYMNSFLRPDLTVDILRGSLSNVVGVVPATNINTTTTTTTTTTTEEERIIEEILLEDGDFFSNCSTLSPESNFYLQFGNRREPTQMFVDDTTNNETYNIGRSTIYGNDVSSSSSIPVELNSTTTLDMDQCDMIMSPPSDTVRDGNSIRLMTGDENNDNVEMGISTPDAGYTTPLDPPKISPVVLLHKLDACVQKGLDESSTAESTVPECRNVARPLARKLIFSDEESPGLKSPKIPKNSVKEEVLIDAEDISLKGILANNESKQRSSPCIKKSVRIAPSPLTFLSTSASNSPESDKGIQEVDTPFLPRLKNLSPVNEFMPFWATPETISENGFRPLRSPSELASGAMIRFSDPSANGSIQDYRVLRSPLESEDHNSFFAIATSEDGSFRFGGFRDHAKSFKLSELENVQILEGSILKRPVMDMESSDSCEN